jgi:hypothetical protein
MSKQETVTGDVAQVDHVATSRSGNPTYRVRLTDGRSYLTATDASVGYGATNYRPHSLRAPVSPVVLTLERGRIVGMARPDGTDA